MSETTPRILVIGAGSRGSSYSKKLISNVSDKDNLGRIVAIAEINDWRKNDFGAKYIWGNRSPKKAESFKSWEDWVVYEKARRLRQGYGQSTSAIDAGGDEDVVVNTVFICVQDAMHTAVIQAVWPLGVHILCEKPLATRLKDVNDIHALIKARQMEEVEKQRVFAICHVLRYSPHNMMLRDLVVEQKIIGEVLNVEHTEPVGWWHFSHSYVRGNWRREDRTAPSLLTKSCHDLDFLLWLLSTPPRDNGDATSTREPHLPARVSSTGRLNYFRRARKPAAAGNATNCLQCPIEPSCKFSAKKIYRDQQFSEGNINWPVDIVVPEIESFYAKGQGVAETKLLDVLAEDWSVDMPEEEVKKRNWFGRCVWESDNDVCDDQTVVLEWDDVLSSDGSIQQGKAAKSATMHMTAMTEKICERRGRIYGTEGEMEYDSDTITVHNFASGKSTTYNPAHGGSGHGGGDSGLIRQFLKAVSAALSGTMSVEEAQSVHLGCSPDDIVRSHALVFAAEEARLKRKVVDWASWWDARDGLGAEVTNHQLVKN
ncbi:NAD(P)-binding protein [Eremomyces bilateralis CBS 781.70]|uniref:NAD(P)-binding protein n=1 Tax=Eremomyces bilateralis CBS 781.70 TaxID=1392243 RepID=A0A6G1G4A0_9PEZI|nr:NAD(P)-binding protein [Eremomyces bilateralis CBS 781.70]KAF1812925.1 NAD(P)-binding protein [Eremomyces bilateralis CBS 781.70]